MSLTLGIVALLLQFKGQKYEKKILSLEYKVVYLFLLYSIKSPRLERKYEIKRFQKHWVKNSHFQDNLESEIELLNYL